MNSALHTVFILVFSILFFTSNYSHAQNVSIKAPNKVNLVYSPFSGEIAKESIELEIETSSGSSKTNQNEEAESKSVSSRTNQFLLQITTLNRRDFELRSKNTKSKLPLSIRSKRQTNRLEFIQNRYVGRIALRAGTAKLQYEALIPGSVFARAEDYQLTIEVAVLDSQSKEVLSKKSFMINARVKPELITNIAGVSRVNSDFGIVDFGELETGEARRLALQVRGNADADISILSENKGQLRITDKSDLFVDYSIEVDGEVSNLANRMQLRRKVAHNFRGSNYPMMIKIGNASGAFAGDYEDTITIEVRPQ